MASRWLLNLNTATPILVGIDDLALVDIDDTVKEVHGYKKQGAGFGYSHVRGLNALLAIISTGLSAPIIIGSSLRNGPTNSARVAAMVSITARMNPLVKAAIATIPDTDWTTTKYTKAILDETTGRWISVAEVAGIPFTRFGSKKEHERITGRLVVRQIPELNKKADVGQATLVEMFRFHTFFTTSTLDTVTADKTHRHHAIIEQTNSDMKASALAHLPSGRFDANAAWLILACIAFNLTRAVGTLASTDLGKATTATVRRKLITVAARVATSARRVTLPLPEHWPWETGWAAMFATTFAPSGHATT